MRLAQDAKQRGAGDLSKIVTGVSGASLYNKHRASWREPDCARHLILRLGEVRLIAMCGPAASTGSS